MKIYTKFGDKGFTKLFSGDIISKNDPLVKSYGKIDTLISFIGFSKALLKSSKYKKNKEINDIIQTLENIQLLCFKLMTDLAGTNSKNVQRINEQDIKQIEDIIDSLWQTIPKLQNFIIPGNDPYSSSIHIARTICREIEPLLIESQNNYNINHLALTFINRLSDLLFTIAIKIDLLINKKLTLIKNNKKIT